MTKKYIINLFFQTNLQKQPKHKEGLFDKEMHNREGKFH